MNTVLFRDGRMLGRNTDWSGYGRAFRAVLPDAVHDRALLVGAGGAGVAVGYGLLRQGASRVDDPRRGRGRQPRACVDRLVPAVRRRARVGDRARPRQRARRRQGVVNATPVGMLGHPGSAVPFDRLRSDLWVSDVVYFPLETELVAAARARGCRVLPGGGMAVQQAVGAFEYFTGLPADSARMEAALQGADRLMRKGIATVSLSGVLRTSSRLPPAPGSTRSSCSTTT